MIFHDHAKNNCCMINLEVFKPTVANIYINKTGSTSFFIGILMHLYGATTAVL